MKERPIIFSAEMVRAILEGYKTMTRRIMKPQPHGSKWRPTYDDLDGIRKVRFIHDIDKEHAISHTVKCPYGKPGDRLWVRETFTYEDCTSGYHDGTDWVDIIYKADGFKHRCSISGAEAEKISQWLEEKETIGDEVNWRPSIHMPRWASRIDLEITNIRAERLQEIILGDILAEGFNDSEMPENLWTFSVAIGADKDWKDIVFAWWINLWGSINGPGAWEANPWVWVIEFKRIGE